MPVTALSLNFSGQLIAEFGDLVQLAPGPRELSNVSVVLSSQACETGATGAPACTTTPGATFTHELTMKLYNAIDPLGTPTVGSVIATLTQTFTIPFRPSADPVNCTGANAGRWFDGTACVTGVAVIVDFPFPAGTTLPDTVIWAISYDTGISGYAPIATPGPYDALNVGALTVNPTVGTDLNEDMAFTAPGPDAVFASELDWTGSRPMARIEAVTPPSTTTTVATSTSAPAPSAPAPTVTTTGELARTGATTGKALALAAAGITLGGVLVASTRRRVRRTET